MLYTQSRSFELQVRYQQHDQNQAACLYKAGNPFVPESSSGNQGPQYTSQLLNNSGHSKSPELAWETTRSATTSTTVTQTLPTAYQAWNVMVMLWMVVITSPYVLWTVQTTRVVSFARVQSMGVSDCAPLLASSAATRKCNDR